MSEVLKVEAFKTVVEAMDKGDYKTANEIMSIINRSLNREKKLNTFSENIALKSKKEEKYFNNIICDIRQDDDKQKGIN